MAEITGLGKNVVKDIDVERLRALYTFNTPDIVRKVGYEEKYDTLLRENKLLFTLDLIKEKLDEAYADTDEAYADTDEAYADTDKAYADTDKASMAEKMIDIMDICEATANPHLLWFRKLLDEHFVGIIAHATYQITSGKVEGINQKIKTLRRHGYGYPDDEYFFLKLFDASRTTYDRKPKSHRICD